MTDNIPADITDTAYDLLDQIETILAGQREKSRDDRRDAREVIENALMAERTSSAPSAAPAKMRSAEEWVRLKLGNVTMEECNAISKLDGGTFERFIRTIQQDALASVAAPEGWVLVPKEPTTVMDNEGVMALGLSGYGAHQKDARACYKAMIAAAPKREV